MNFLKDLALIPIVRDCGMDRLGKANTRGGVNSVCMNLNKTKN